MNIIDQVKQTLIEEIEASIRKANLAEDIPEIKIEIPKDCLLYTSPSPRDATLSRMPSSA